MAVLEATPVKTPIQNMLTVDFPVQPDLDIEHQVQLLEKLDLPAEDGIPMETNWHRSAMNLLIDSVHALWHERNDYFVGGNMFIYFSLEQVRRKHYRGPDFFVVNHVDGTRDRDSWIVWKEDGRYPDVIVELASTSTIEQDLTVKKDLYEQTFHTTDYFCYNPATRHLLGWHLANTQYEQLEPNEKGWLWSQQLNVWVGLWEGEFHRIRAGWPRLYTAEGQLVLTLAEAETQRAEAEAQRAEAEAQRAEAEAQRAERFAAKLRELGVDPNTV